MKNHSLLMIIGCALPLLLFYLLPTLGAGKNFILFIFIALMIGIHLLMMMGHKRKPNHPHGNDMEHGSH